MDASSNENEELRVVIAPNSIERGEPNVDANSSNVPAPTLLGKTLDATSTAEGFYSDD
jgi:hypothetical protein